MKRTVLFWIIGVSIIVAGTTTLLLLPKSYAESPVIFLILMGIFLAILYARRFQGEPATDSAIARRAKEFSRPYFLWLGLGLLFGAFIWLFAGLMIAGAISGSPYIAFIPFVFMLVAGAALISLRFFTWLSNLMGY